MNKNKRETARVRTQEPLKKTAKVGTLAAREDPKTFKDLVERWRVQEKQKEEKWKKKKKKVKKNKVQRKDRKIPHGREERRRGRKERQEE